MSAINEDVESVYNRVGVFINKSMSVSQQIEAAGLNWQIKTSHKRFGSSFQYISTSKDKVTMYREGKNGRGIYLDDVGQDYKPIQNKTFVEAVNEFALSSGAELERLGYLDNGRVVFAGLKLRYEIDVAKVGDIMTCRLLATNYNMLNKACKIIGWQNRLVCNNVMSDVVKLPGINLTHASFFDSSTIHKVLEAAMSGVSKYEATVNTLASVPISKGEAVAWLLGHFGKKHPKTMQPLPLEKQSLQVLKMIELFNGAARGSELLSACATAWGLLNSATEEINRYSIQRMRAGLENHMYQIWFGRKASAQNKFMGALVDYYTQQKA